MDAQTPIRAGRKEWIGLSVLALPCLLYSMDLTVLNLAVPELSAELKPSSSQLLWIIDIYGFMVAGLLITMGTLGDRIGRRRLLLAGATLFGITSVLAAFSTSAEMLIVTRALLGIAGATLAPSTLSLIRHMFYDPGQRTVAIGVWITCYSVGGAIGPLVGGVLLEYFWWGSVFLIAVPVMALLLVLGPMLLPEYRDPNAGRLDILSAALSLVAVLSAIYGFKRIAEHGFDNLAALAIIAGAAFGAIFIRRQTRLDDPMIDVRLFKVPSFTAALATNTVAIFGAFGAFLFTAQYLQLVEGLSPLRAGFWSLPSSAGFIAGGVLSPMIVKRVHPSHVVGAGLAIAAAGFLVLTQIESDNGLAILVAGSVIFSLGLAPVFTLTTDLIVGAAPPEHAGAASAISETGAEFGGALGIAILGSIATAVYRHDVANALPAGISPESANTARDTLGGAVGVAATLPEPAGTALLASAREAFVQGMQITTAIGAAVLIVAAVLAVLMLRHVQPAQHNDEPAAEPIDKLEPAELAEAA
jgi:MFS transporter, DHA2 family, multidrug resistance protein